MVDWPHAPMHRLGEPGAYIVTGGTYGKEHLFSTAEKLDMLCDSLFSLAEDYECQLQAWSLFSNHYHFVAASPDDPASLGRMITRLHAGTATQLNRMDDAPGRRVWYQYWDTHLTFEKSFFARLNYVHQNPVKHGIVEVAHKYPWCSAAWFERTAEPSFVKSIFSFKTDKVNVEDGYTLECGALVPLFHRSQIVSQTREIDLSSERESGTYAPHSKEGERG